MTIYITKQSHYNFQYLLNWQNPDTGCMMGTWFHDMKELKEYTAHWIIGKTVKIGF